MPDSALMPAPLRTTNRGLEVLCGKLRENCTERRHLFTRGAPRKTRRIFATDERTSIHCLRFGGHLLKRNRESGNHRNRGRETNEKLEIVDDFYRLCVPNLS